MLLALDTATATASLALYDEMEEQLLAEWTWQARRRQTQDLLVTAQQLLKQMDVAPQALTALAVTTGPGSFTGVRIAISAAKGIGLALPAPTRVVGLPTLCVTAAPWLSLIQSSNHPITLCAYIQAGRGRYNWAWFPTPELLWRPGVDDHHAGSAEEFGQALARHNAHFIWLAGEPDTHLQTVVQPLAHVLLIDAVSSWRRAGQLARLAGLHLAHGVEDDLRSLQPLYLRSP